MSELSYQAVDRDGAVGEALAGLPEGDSRSDFLRKSVVMGGALAGGGALFAALAETAHAQSRGDVAILNFALTLEYLEAEFYREAVRRDRLSGDTRRFARVVARHEATHVRTLKSVLGSSAVGKPRFNFRGTTSNQRRFQATAQALEDTGVRAYLGQAANLDSDDLVTAAGTIVTVEARHAAWIRHIRGESPAPRAFDDPATKRQILRIVGRTRFIVPARRQRPRRRRAPSFTG
ncbi:MAG: ferritin-like domain-containing protein [Thermoleophilaceae bacterium]